MTNIEPFPRVARIDLAEVSEFDLGGMMVKPAERVVTMNDVTRDVQPRVMQVLVALAKARSTVVSRDRLTEQCWNGQIVSDDALNRCVLALRHLAQQFTPEPFSIETVPRVGFRLVERADDIRSARMQSLAGKPWRLAALMAALMLAVAALFIWQNRGAGQAPASIAVLPFRTLPSGDTYFAEGISEEILDRLSREPQFRVAGGSSSSQMAKSLDLQEAAKRLHVDYVVEGTVRRQRDQVRVSAYLVRAKDGTRLWSGSYDGTLDDVFVIQGSIGTAIAGALKRKLVRAPALSGPLVTNGNAYSLYLTARGLIRTRNRRAGPMAADLLRDAIQSDRGYAPAWASLGEATLLAGALKDQESFVASAAEAQGYARHALRLAPELPEAHRVLGGLLGFGTPEATAHMRRAAELDPNNAETMLGFGAAQGAAGEFEKELVTYQRALEIDPLWFRAVAAFALATVEMGDRSKAERIAKQGLPANDIHQQLLFGKIAATSGDYSEAVRRLSIVTRANSPRWSGNARRNRDQLTFALGLRTGPLLAVPRPLDQRHFERISMGDPPEPPMWQIRNGDRVAAAVFRDDNHVAAKLMLGRGRWRELATAYDGHGGLVGIRRGQRLRVDQLSEAPVVVLALRQAGRGTEADQLLKEAANLIDAVYRRGRVPFWFDADAGALLAVRGSRDEALSRLDRAIERGWRHGGSTDLPDIADEPAFRSLRDDNRFQQLRSRLSAHLAREREETRRLRL